MVRALTAEVKRSYYLRLPRSKGSNALLFLYFFRPPALRFLGTFAPARRASLKPIAMACLRLVTFLPERPDLSVPRLRSCIARSTFFCAFFPYFAIADDLRSRECKAGAPRFAPRQSLRILVDDADECVHERAVAPALRRFLGQDLEGFATRPRDAIRALGRERVKHIDNGDNLREQRHGQAAEPVGIARTIQPLVMVPDDRPHGIEGPKPRAQRIPDQWVLAHDAILLGIELAILEQDGVGYGDLADVVKISATLQRTEIALVES